MHIIIQWSTNVNNWGALNLACKNYIIKNVQASAFHKGNWMVYTDILGKINPYDYPCALLKTTSSESKTKRVWHESREIMKKRKNIYKKYLCSYVRTYTIFAIILSIKNV